MAIALKTIEYVMVENEASLATNTLLAFTQLTINIPETTNRTFKSVFLEISCNDNDSASANLTNFTINQKVGAGAKSTDGAETYGVSNSGESQFFQMTKDITSYFVTNFTGTSHALDVDLTMNGCATVNHTCKIIITYEYNSSNTTRIKTVKIPLDSSAGVLSTSLTEVGTNQVPNLNSFLPESSKTYRDIWFEFVGNTGANGTTAGQLGCALDAEASDPDATNDNTQASGVSFRRLWKRTDMTTNATHALKLRTYTSNQYPHVAIILCVTYEYASSSSTIINSIQLVMPANSMMGNTTSGDKTRLQLKFLVEEPATLTLAQSAILMAFMTGIAITSLSIGVGSQTVRTYTHAVGSVDAGQYALTHRLDSSAIAGTGGLTLARGENTITVDCYFSSSTFNPYITALIIYLNYTSGKASDGDHVHNSTVQFLTHDTRNAAAKRESSSIAPDIPPTDYWLTNIGSYITVQDFGKRGYGHYEAELQSGEFAADGYALMNYLGQGNAANENGFHYLINDASDLFKKSSADPASKMNLETTRKWKLLQGQGNTLSWDARLIFTYHSIVVTKSGTISGSGGGTVTIKWYRDDTKELIGASSRSGNGSHSLTWFDDVLSLFCEAKEDSTHLGRSDTGVS